MGKTSDGRWTISVGPHGAKVRAREHPEKGSNVYLFAWDPDLGGNRKESLGFKVRDANGDLIEDHVKKAKAEAGKLSNKIIQGEAPGEDKGPDSTVGRVFDLFRREEITSDLSEKHRAELERGLDCWESFLGRDSDLQEFDRGDWNAFKRQRSSGAIDGYGRQVRAEKDRREVSNRTVGKDLKTLRQACRFAMGWRDREARQNLLDSDPTFGIDIPKNDDPARPGCSDELLAALLKEAAKVTRRVRGNGKNKSVRTCLRELILVATGTGHRIGAIRQLRWSDWDPDAGKHGAITWRGEHQKDGKTRKTPVTASVRKALEEQRQRFPGVGEAYIFPAPDSDGALRDDVARRWLIEAEKAARGHHVHRWGWHAFRRRWRDKMGSVPDRTNTAALAGWSNAQTMDTVYARERFDKMEQALEAGDPSRVEAAAERSG